MTAQSATPDIIKRNIKRNLPCKLTDPEFVQIAKLRATREAEVALLEFELAEDKRQRQEQIGLINSEVKRMGHELRIGLQDRTVSCQEEFRVGDDGEGWVITIRCDNSDEVERRSANAHECQRHLVLEPIDPVDADNAFVDAFDAFDKAEEDADQPSRLQLIEGKAKAIKKSRAGKPGKGK